MNTKMQEVDTANHSKQQEQNHRFWNQSHHWRRNSFARIRAENDRKLGMRRKAIVASFKLIWRMAEWSYRISRRTSVNWRQNEVAVCRSTHTKAALKLIWKFPEGQFASTASWKSPIWRSRGLADWKRKSWKRKIGSRSSQYLLKI